MEPSADTPRSASELHAQLRQELAALHLSAGEPSFRAMATAMNKVLSHTTVRTVLRCQRVPGWGNLELVVRTLKGDVDHFKDLWQRIRELERPSQPVSSPEPQPEPQPGSGTLPRRNGVFDSSLVSRRFRNAEDFRAKGDHESACREMELAVAANQAELAHSLVEADKLAEAATILDHVMAVLAKTVTDPSDPEFTLASRYYADLLARQGRPDEAIKKLRELPPRTGAYDFESAEIGYTLATILSDQGQTAQAEHEVQQVVRFRRQALGENHPDTLRAEHDLAVIAWRRGRSEEAYQKLAAVLAIQTRLFGFNHQDILRTAHNQARVLISLGQLAAAEQECRRVLVARTHLLGESHKDTLRTRNNLAVALSGQGRMAEAETELRRMVEVLQRQRDESGHDLDTQAAIGVRINIANMYSEAGDHARAEREYREILNLQTDLFIDAIHPEILGTRHNIAIALYYQNRVDEAISDLEAVGADQRRALGSEHPETLATLHNLASILFAMGRFADAQTRYEQLLESRQRVLGPSHAATLETRRSLRLARRRQGQDDDHP